MVVRQFFLTLTFLEVVGVEVVGRVTGWFTILSNPDILGGGGGESGGQGTRVVYNSF